MAMKNGTARRLAAGLALGLAAVAWAMPTKQQLMEVQQLVKDLTADDLRALKAKEKTAGDVAAAHLALADKAETEAGKYLLLQGAFRLYARSGDYDSAAATLQRMRADIADLPPEVVVEIVNNEMRRVAASKAPKVLAIFRDAQRTIACRKRLAAAEADAKANPANAAAMRRLAECHVGLGDWAHALPLFAKLGVAAAKHELDPASVKDFDALKAADFWWDYKAADPDPYKAHAAALYRAAIDGGPAATGLKREIAAKRLAEAEKIGLCEAGGPKPAAPISEREALAPSKAPAPTTGPWAIPANFTAPLVRTLKLADGVDMDFCACPAGSFKMQNSGKGDHGVVGSHKVAITRPFWFSKTLVTAKQYRQLIPHAERDEKCKEIEELFPEFDVTHDIYFSNIQRYLEKMNEKYAATLPKGYVFRLPTDAEWEYVLYGDWEGKRRRVFWNTGNWHANLYDKKNVKWRECQLMPRDQLNKWGVVGWGTNSKQMVLDKTIPREDGNDGYVGKEFTDNSEKADPLREGNRYLWRQADAARVQNKGGSGLFRVVIGPDLVAEKKAEKEAASVSVRGTSVPPTVVHEAPSPLPPANVKTHVIKLNDSVNMEFVECPPGTFTMGKGDAPAHVRAHKVTITRPFWIARTKLTVEQIKTWQMKYQPPKEALAMGGDRIPVSGAGNGIWKDARFNLDEYCDYLTKKYRSSIPRGYVFRLPTEAEWEYAYTAGETDPDSFYAQFRRIDGEGVDSKLGFSTKALNAIAESKGLPATHDWARTGVAVAQLPPNRWGLYDMAGNTPEVMMDTFDLESFAHDWAFDHAKQTALRYADEETDPLRIAPANAKRIQRIVRGGDIGKLWKRQSIPANSYRLVVGPDLVAEKQAAKK